MSIKNILRKLNSRDTRILPNINTLTKIIFIALITITATFFIKNILATDKTTVDEFTKKQGAMKTGNNQESWMNEAASSNLMVANKALMGDVEFDDNGNIKTSWVPNGIIGVTNQAIASLYNPPFSGVQYIAQAVNNFLGKPAYAATGYQGLSTILPLWKGFRNVTYTVFSIIFIGIGIAIMLRIKISQNAVITIQSAIPNLITSLILVTFSYAIVGLLIDLSYVVEALGVSLIYKASGNTQLVSDIITNPNIIGKLSGLFFSGPVVIVGVIAAIISGVLIAIPATTIIGVIVLLVIIVGVALFFVVNLLKFLFGILKCYTNIILRTIVGPLEIAVGSIPNMKIGFGTWFINIVANLLVFPISMIFLVMIKALMDAIGDSNGLWTPPGIGILGDKNIIAAAIGLSSFVLLAKLPAMIPEFIFQIKPSPFGKAIGESFAGPAKWAKGATRSGFNSILDNKDVKYGDKDGSWWQKALYHGNKLNGGKSVGKPTRTDGSSV